MDDLIDREELKEALIHQGVYSELVRRVVREAPEVKVEDKSAPVVLEMERDLVRMGRLNESLRMANRLLVEENRDLKALREANSLLAEEIKDLKAQILALKESLNPTVLFQKTCEDCGSEFWGGRTARYCFDCRKKRMSENAKSHGLYKLGGAALSRKMALKRQEAQNGRFDR